MERSWEVVMEILLEEHCYDYHKFEAETGVQVFRLTL
jgi:hypothetical protein